LSFGIAKLLGMSDEAGLGLLAIGAAPGGGGSNVFSYLLDGDLELSITMSFISTVASLGKYITVAHTPKFDIFPDIFPTQQLLRSKLTCSEQMRHLLKKELSLN
jgi:hypothetical protein